MIKIRPLEKQNWPAVWQILAPVFRAGETYAYAPDMSSQQAFQVWVEQPMASYMAEDDNGTLLGTYYLKPNQPALGSHVCNCGYVVADAARGRGVASEMCLHSQHEAVRLGFRAMQFNLVVASNVGAVRLWQRLGFDIVGTLPSAFQHPRQGDVDAYVMYKILQPLSAS